MKYYLLFIILNLAIIFAYAEFDDKKVRIEKMENHLRKIKGILRNLDTSDEDDDDDDSTDDEDSSNEDNPSNYNSTEPNTETETPTTSPVVVTLPSTPKKETKNRDALVHLIGFNSFKAPPEAHEITFRTFFTYKNIRPARWVLIRIVISIRSFRLRYLDDDEIKYENANCTISKEDEDKLDGNVRYDCSAPKSPNVTVTNASVYNVEINEPNLTVKDEDINYSVEAALAASSLYSQTKETEKIFRLYNGKLSTYSDYFIINGKINDTDFYKYGINDPLILQVTDETQSKPYNVSCKATSLGNDNYEFRCTPEEEVKGTILAGTIRDSHKYEISVNIESGKTTIDYSKNATEKTNYNKGVATYRKSSSGLSGGAIAGIVIACVVVLIIASLVAIMMRKSAAAAAPFQSETQTPSIVGLRSVDNNYTQ